MLETILKGVWSTFIFFLLDFQTDDKGVFSTSITEEYNIAADTFELSADQVWQLSYNSIDNIFSDEETKQLLRDKWKTLKVNVLSES